MSISVYYVLKKSKKKDKFMKHHLHTRSSITCSDCGHTSDETMPLDACIYLYECKNCQKLMTPDSGDCCIFCSHGTHHCPTSQRESRAYSEMPSASFMTTSTVDAAQAG